MEPVLVIDSGLVIDDGTGPRLCLGPILLSHPPQGGGPLLVGWSWPERGVERAAGVTWCGVGRLLGWYDGGTFTVVRELTAIESDALPDREDDGRDLSAPCPEPTGGWVAPDPDRATTADMYAAFRRAAALPHYADSWIDDRGDKRQRPELIVIVVRVADDVEGAERAVREVWGGSLCVTEVSWTEAGLRSIRDEIIATSDVLIAGASDRVVELEVTYDDGTMQRSMDATYGEGVVRVTSALVRAPDGME